MSATARDYQSLTPPDTEGLDDLFEPVLDTVQPNVGHVQDTVQLEVLDSVLSEIDSDLDVSSSKNDHVQDTVLAIVQQQSEQLKNAYTYLDAATARILYLQQQLENKDQEIKLLTDSQHKAGWWSRLLNRIGIK